MLYPIKFKPQYQYRIWGGDKLRKHLNRRDAPEMTGESWEISAVDGAMSVVTNGFLEGNDLQEVIEVYMGDLVGDSVYKKFGDEFPLLIKLIDAQKVLSIQVHPGDELAKKRHQAYGKTEMWYVIQADPEAFLYVGFNQPLTKEAYLDHLNRGTLRDILNQEPVQAGDAFYIPAGRVHAAGAGILFAEIQQTSDITYRMYDWDRIDKNGKPRHLHTELALDAIDFTHHTEYRNRYQVKPNTPSPVVSCPYFTTNILDFNKILPRDLHLIDSFVVYMCLEGSFSVDYQENERVEVAKGETILVPATINDIRFIPKQRTKALEVYIELEPEEEELEEGWK